MRPDVDWNLTETFDTAEGVIRWQRLGSDSSGDEPVVLVHGTPYSSYLWRDIAPALAQHRSVYVFDLLGYGQSEQREGQDLTIAAQARRLADLLEHWGLKRPSMIANDIGAAIALHASLVNGAAYRDLVIFDAVTGSDWEMGLFHLVRRNAGVFEALPGYAHRALITSHLQRATHSGFRPGVLERYLQPWLGADGQAAFYRQYQQLSVDDTRVFEDKLAGIDIPVKILWGRDDLIMAPKYGEWIRDQIPHAEFHWIDDAGHVLQEDVPVQLLTHLTAPFAQGVNRSVG
ncbi:alpha/beta hydrolase [Mycolicibacterium smegmatis]|uniref:alpha/beta fold hydrolase n=1 Tax=Mycolicibacterium smegmatis TaxID=1772 RepID=UPI0005D764AE|nr:alpha/beta hydrolase [Mycolicibacterium smegmatis]MDF1898535.1 alpha/beta hydrolase [Mycolicibacterium smegmatis]MDF1908176.1 alpha/beta hydrolase [Mycolicibacterium smegmatis]MDF1915743.1 alpha/beta hydrolase [Mycolicibacterium smegmatis]MDF1926344.1 alpha/beta hydrolase [Mycolicibacterium smegmatis]UAK54889.1 alpha/beta hydrolase [Mycolicibacterium smegmatis]